MKSKRAREAADAVAPVADPEPQIDAAEPSKKKRKRDGEDAVAGDEKPKKVKKDKKDKKSRDKKESRKEKKDKRKDLLDLPEADEPEEAETAVVTNGAAKDAKSPKKDRKEKKSKSDSGAAAVTAGAIDADADAEKQQKKKDKKAKKKAKAIEATATTNGAEKSETATNGVSSGDGIDLDDPSAAGAAADGEDAKQDRHIVFVGNLPYTATAATISAHFASLSPVAVRCLREKGDDAPPCRGIAFVEFGKVWHQRTCLDKFHHSMFDDGKSAPRKINVELTAGGGGKAKQRQDKIRDKNKKLDENRAKRIQREKDAKENGQGDQAAPPKPQEASIEDSIHPSRRGRVPGMR